MAKYIVNDNGVDREATKDEIIEIEKRLKENDKIEEALLEEAKLKNAERQAILDRLGLTADEAKLLLG